MTNNKYFDGEDAINHSIWIKYLAIEGNDSNNIFIIQSNKYSWYKRRLEKQNNGYKDELDKLECPFWEYPPQ